MTCLWVDPVSCVSWWYHHTLSDREKWIQPVEKTTKKNPKYKNNQKTPSYSSYFTTNFFNHIISLLGSHHNILVFSLLYTLHSSPPFQQSFIYIHPLTYFPLWEGETEELILLECTVFLSFLCMHNLCTIDTSILVHFWFVCLCYNFDFGWPGTGMAWLMVGGTEAKLLKIEEKKKAGIVFSGEGRQP